MFEAIEINEKLKKNNSSEKQIEKKNKNFF